VFGCGYRRIADATCSATTLRRRRDEWIHAGVAGQLRLAAWRPAPTHVRGQAERGLVEKTRQALRRWAFAESVASAP
jgi:hypothetical protein